jgi:hypothetical protein
MLSITNTAYNVTRGAGNITKYYKGVPQKVSGWGDIHPPSHESFEDRNGKGSCYCHEENKDHRPYINFAVDCTRVDVSLREALISFETASELLR